MYNIVTKSSQTDDLLARVCEDLQLSPTQHKIAEERYQTIGKFLATHPELKPFRPEIYPQGSLAHGTTLKPPKKAEYDLDLVSQFAIKREQVVNPTVLLDGVERYFRANDIYRSMVSRKNRCVRITYANDFHMDILPAIPDLSGGGTCLLVPDRKAQGWKASNPRGFSSWFKSAAHTRFVEATRRIEPLPEHETAEEKQPLELVVQLLKRNRDLVFESAPEGVAPISIVLTTLAAENYQGQQSVSAALSGILRGIIARLPANGRLRVLNPQNPAEDLSEKWDERADSYPAFVAWIQSLQRQWETVILRSGIHNVTGGLEVLFGETIIREAVRKQAAQFQATRVTGSLGVSPMGTLTPISTPGTVRIPKNEFFGE